MKHLKIALIALFVVVGFSNVNAQDEENKWAFGVGINAIDFYGGYDLFSDAKNSLNVTPAPSKITIGRYIGSGFTFELGGSQNRLFRNDGVQLGKSGVGLNYLAVDGTFKFAINELLKEKSTWFDPYLGLGIGYASINNNGGATFNYGAGINFWAFKNVGFNLQVLGKTAFSEPKSANDVADHFQSSLGLVYKFGAKDTDDDGILDKDDTCPLIAGLKEFNGCPDTDNDGVPDSEDECPLVFGLKELKGCPDADEDGVADIHDDCPEVFGLKELKGCPDADGDGVADKDDLCPTIVGSKENKGCPWPDTDGDGIFDKDDKCPEVKGAAANNGCPHITTTAQMLIKDAAKGILFDTARATFKKGITDKLDVVANIMQQFDTANFVIEGHTDNTGSVERNQTLSISRANRVRDYLISKGIISTRLSAIGYGESRPVDTNATNAGRKNNRRAEINFVVQ